MQTGGGQKLKAKYLGLDSVLHVHLKLLLKLVGCGDMGRAGGGCMAAAGCTAPSILCSIQAGACSAAGCSPGGDRGQHIGCGIKPKTTKFGVILGS